MSTRNSSRINKSSSTNNGVNNMLILKDPKQLQCVICMEVMYNATSCYPCLHSYCCGCIAKWYMENKKCPTCRSPTSDLVENRDIVELVEKFLEQNPRLERSEIAKNQLDEFEIEYLTKKFKNKTTIVQHIRKYDYDPLGTIYSDIKIQKDEIDRRLRERLLKLSREKLERLQSMNIGNHALISKFAKKVKKLEKSFNVRVAPVRSNVLVPNVRVVGRLQVRAGRTNTPHPVRRGRQRIDDGIAPALVIPSANQGTPATVPTGRIQRVRGRARANRASNTVVVNEASNDVVANEASNTVVENQASNDVVVVVVPAIPPPQNNSIPDGFVPRRSPRLLAQRNRLNSVAA